MLALVRIISLLPVLTKFRLPSIDPPKLTPAPVTVLNVTAGPPAVLRMLPPVGKLFESIVPTIWLVPFSSNAPPLTRRALSVGVPAVATT